MVAASQVKMTQSYVSDLLTYGELRCKGETCPTFASDMCDMMNSCNGHGQCGNSTYGKCVCNSGWYGADCTVQVNALSDEFATTLQHTTWTYFKVTPSEVQSGFSAQIAANSSFDLYIRRGTDAIPDPSNFDAVLK